MKTKLMMMPAAAMVVCLATYAFSIATPIHQAAPMRAMMPSGMDAERSAGLAQREQRLKQEMEAREASIVSQLALSEQQAFDYRRLADWMREQNAAMKAKTSGHIQRGIEINSQFQDGLRRIFTPDQIQTYLELWKQPDGNEPASLSQAEERIAAPIGDS